MSELLQELLEMGFPENRAQKALFLTNNKGLSEAIDWYYTHFTIKSSSYLIF